MKYQLKGGILTPAGGKPAARIKACLPGSEKQILAPDGGLLLRAQIVQLPAPAGQDGNPVFREYRLTAPDGTAAAVARPAFAPAEDPERFGWPVCRMPRVDRAAVTFGGREGLLRMNSSREYVLLDASEAVAVRIVHLGTAGGWSVEAPQDFSPALLCGLFVFCRLIEKENELPAV